LGYSQNFVFAEGVLARAERYVRAVEMLAGLTGNVYPIDVPKSMKQLLPTGFIPSLHGTVTRWDFAVFRRDPFHLVSDG